MPLRQGLAEYALISAFKDSRFRKIERRELPSLECGLVHLVFNIYIDVFSRDALEYPF